MVTCLSVITHGAALNPAPHHRLDITFRMLLSAVLAMIQWPHYRFLLLCPESSKFAATRVSVLRTYFEFPFARVPELECKAYYSNRKGH